jgi:hypothetical protein
VPVLPDDAVVVRGGASRDPQGILDKIEDAIADGAGAVLSVFCVAREGRDEASAILSACIGGDVPHKQILVTSAGALRQAGFGLEPDSSDGQPDCHHHVLFGGDLSIQRVEAFIACFDGPMPNPTGGKRRREQS